MHFTDYTKACSCECFPAQKYKNFAAHLLSSSLTIRMASSLLGEAARLIEKIPTRRGVSKQILRWQQYCLEPKSSNSLSRGVPRIILQNLHGTAPRAAQLASQRKVKSGTLSLSRSPSRLSSFLFPARLLPPPPLLSKTHRCGRQT